MRRPERVLRFAWNPNPAPEGGAIEPPSGEAEGGWVRGERPAAQYVNALFNNYGSWLDFLRGPSLSRWTRSELSGTLDTGHAISLAADTTTVEGDTVLRRLVLAGQDGGGLCVYVSRRGDDWVRYDNFPGGITSGELRVRCIGSTWWIAVDDGATGALLYSPADGFSGTALDGVSPWTERSFTFAGGVDNGIRAFATGNFLAAAARKRIYQSFGGTFTAATVTGDSPDAGLGSYTDILWDALLGATTGTLIAVSDRGDVLTSTTPSTSFAHASRITTETGQDWRLSLGATGEVIAWRWAEATVGQHYWRTTDHGVSWEEIAPTTGPTLVTSLVYDAGTWVATSTVAPYVWSSNDLVAWVPAKLPFFEADNALAYGAVQSEGAWIVARPGTVLTGDRAEDLAPGAWSVDPTPTTLGNAGWLRGCRIAVTAPTDGQTLVWNASTSQYEPATPASTGTDLSTLLTTNDDILMRLAGVPARFATTSTGKALMAAANKQAAREATESDFVVRTKTTAYTALAGDVLLCDASGAAFTVTLPTAAGKVQSIRVKKTDASANTVTVDGAGTETIDGALTLALVTQYEAVELWSDGSNWWVF